MCFRLLWFFSGELDSERSPPDRYLVLEKLKKEDAQRIHVFSSFFYKRLNQRERRNVADAANLP